jgi:regulator of sirC expression with transglutaminase-like and TPR domain
MINERELWALFTLLDDQSVVVHEQVRARLHELGEETIGPLRAVSAAHNRLHHELVEEVVNAIRMDATTERLRRLNIHSPRIQMLEDAVFVIAKYGHPDVNVPAYVEQLDTMASDVRVLSGSNATPVDRLMRLRGYLFSELGFGGNRQNYYDPDNSYFNRVIDYRRGIPLTLSVLMLLLGARLKIPLFGIGLPMHFLVHYDDGTRSFLVDPFNSGTIITRQECEAMVSTGGKPLPPAMFQPVSNKEIIERMMRNLYVAYQQNGDHREADRIGRLIQVVNPDFRVNTSSDPESETDEMDTEDDA